MACPRAGRRDVHRSHALSRVLPRAALALGGVLLGEGEEGEGLLDTAVAELPHRRAGAQNRKVAQVGAQPLGGQALLCSRSSRRSWRTPAGGPRRAASGAPEPLLDGRVEVAQKRCRRHSRRLVLEVNLKVVFVVDEHRPAGLSPRGPLASALALRNVARRCSRRFCRAGGVGELSNVDLPLVGQPDQRRCAREKLRRLVSAKAAVGGVARHRLLFRPAECSAPRRGGRSARLESRVRLVVLLKLEPECCAVVALRGLGGGFVAENRRWRLPRCTAGAAAAAGEGQRAGGEGGIGGGVCEVREVAPFVEQPVRLVRRGHVVTERAPIEVLGQVEVEVARVVRPCDFREAGRVDVAARGRGGVGEQLAHV